MAFVEIEAQQNELVTQLKHGPSGSLIATVPPKDNGGDGSSFSPTDLMAGSLLACALVTMMMGAKREKIPLEAPRGKVQKEMTSQGPRRIAKLTVHIEMSASLSVEHRARLEEIAHGCPVKRSLSPEVQVPMTFAYLDS